MRRLLAALVFVSLTACGKLGSDFGPQIDGKWTGTVAGQSVILDLIQTGNITGVATITGGTVASRSLAVSGTFSNPTLDVTLAGTTAAESIELDAVVAGRTMTGTFTGGGFTGNAIVLTRQ